jgi:hypothetical protein
MGSTAAEVRMKANFPAPEIWVAEQDPAAAKERARGLLDAGLNMALVPGSTLAAVPSTQHATTVGLSEQGLSLTVAGEAFDVAVADQIVAVRGERPGEQPGKREPRRSSTPGGPATGGPRVPAPGGGITGAVFQAVAGKASKKLEDARDDAAQRLGDLEVEPEPALFVDLYVHKPDGWQTIRITTSNIDFSGLGAAKQPTARANLQQIVDALRDRFTNAKVDERLVHVTFHHGIVSGVALSKVLTEISADLGSLPLMDVGSRLAFLTTK